MDIALLVVMTNEKLGFMRFLVHCLQSCAALVKKNTCCLQASKAENLSTPSTNCPKRTHKCYAPVARMMNSGIVAIGDAVVESLESWSMAYGAFLDPSPFSQF